MPVGVDRRSAGGRLAETRYDEAGRAIRTTFADFTFIAQTYDDRGRRTSATDLIGPTTNYEYDEQGRLTAVGLPEVDDGQRGLARPRNVYEYDTHGNQTLIRDALGRQTSRILTDGAAEARPYSTEADFSTGDFPIVGQLKVQTDFIGNQHKPHYDSSGRVDLVEWFTPTGTHERRRRRRGGER
jgi:YD repeat-containing protein